jgi:glycosyltransferase involved in cell wall biosynthesis
MESTSPEDGNYLSLVLATVGRTSELIRFLESMCAQTDTEFELIVVDQNADRRLEEIVDGFRRRGLALRHVKAPRRGLSFARNLGLGYVRGGLIGFPDDDCWYEPATVENIRESFGRATDTDFVVGHWSERSGDAGIEHRLETAAVRRFRSVPIASIGLFLRRKWIGRIGGFDERLGVGAKWGASEETDLVFRLIAAGASGVYSPTVVVHHVWRTRIEADKWLDVWRSARSRARGSGAIYAKHRLETWVIVRGVVGPMLRTPLSGTAIVMGLASSYGRLEGFICWILQDASNGPESA